MIEHPSLFSRFRLMRHLIVLYINGGCLVTRPNLNSPSVCHFSQYSFDVGTTVSVESMSSWQFFTWHAVLVFYAPSQPPPYPLDVCTLTIPFHSTRAHFPSVPHDVIPDLTSPALTIYRGDHARTAPVNSKRRCPSPELPVLSVHIVV